MKVEEEAIVLITSVERRLQRTREGNPGFDLYETDDAGRAVRWVEIKSMTGSLDDRPVGLSHTQFSFAREKGRAFWLYVVEYATEPTKARILRIQDPHGMACTFTFDRGWRAVARTDPVE